jgi:post-segregation antitoxin (ccd killing protein)
MKIFFKFLLVIVVIGAIAGYIYWQKNKKAILKDSIQNTVQQKTDNLYYIHYDSSQIDEVNGNASFYKVSLQSDSVQKALLQTTDSLPNALYNINVAEVTVKGIDMVGLLQKQNVAAKSILLSKPVIQIINTGADNPKTFANIDTLALYQQILGKYKSIRADTIQVVNGTVLVTNKKGQALTTLENINISLNNFLVDSTRNYQNIISYFIKDVKVTVENIQLPESKNGTRINISKLLYDAPEKIIRVQNIQQYKAGNTTPIADMKNIEITQLNTNAFVLNQQLKAGLVSCDGGLLTIYRKKKTKQSGEEAIELSNELIDEAQIGGIRISNTKIIIIDPFKPTGTPFIINDVKFLTSKVVNLTKGNTINDLINNADWELSAGGFSFLTKEKLYQFSVNNAVLNNKMGTIKIKTVLLKPLVTETEFAKLSKVQKPRFDLAFSNIELKEVNFKKLISANILEVESGSLQPVIKIFKDRTLPLDTSIKLSTYPPRLLSKLPFPFYIKKLVLNKGAFFYKEKGMESHLPGTLYFTNINAVISNATNIPSKFKKDSTLSFKARTEFLGIAHLETEWLMPLKSQRTPSVISGTLGPIDATMLNQLTEPLGMASVKKGQINKLSFDFKCTDYKSDGTATFLYNDLTVEVLKNEDDELKKKGLVTFLANTLIKNNNPVNNDTYIGIIDYKRDIQKSFFNLLWKSIFDGVKKTVLRK